MKQRGQLPKQHQRNRVSVVVSAYNEEGNVEVLWKSLSLQLDQLKNIETYEVLFVDDGSKDKTFAKLLNLQKSESRIKIIKLSRNFGHEIAMTAGMDYASGDSVVLMDADLQHPPDVVPQLIEQWQQGSDIVLTRRMDAGGKSTLKRLIYNFAYWVLNKLQEQDIPTQSPDFRLIDRYYIDVLKNMDEKDRMLRGLLTWVAADDCTFVDFSPAERLSGESKYSFRSLFKLGIDGILAFTDRPLKLALYLGAIALFFALALTGFTIWHHYAVDSTKTGYATIVVAVSLFSSIQLIILGIIGLYLGRIHMEVKSRPLYVAKLFGFDQ